MQNPLYMYKKKKIDISDASVNIIAVTGKTICITC